MNKQLPITERYKVTDLPAPLRSGEWELRRFTVDEKAAALDRLRAVFNGGGCYCRAGTYTGLYRAGKVIMSDTADEIYDHLQAIVDAEREVLIAGLGIGMVLNAIAMKPEVNHITVVELSKGVLDLLQLHYERKYPGKITFVNADILTWVPPKGAHWDFAWFDIWDDLNTDNLIQMATLHRKFARKATTKDSWGRKLLLRERRKEREQEKVYSFIRDRHQGIEELSKKLDAIHEHEGIKL
jgi:hypothetical protein